MPVVRVSMWTGRTREQKEKLAEAITTALVDISKTQPEHVNIVFEDIEKSNWAIAGKLSD